MLSGPPNPPLHIRMDGQTLHDVRTDQQTWTTILKKVLSGKLHPGVTVDKTSFETLIRTKSNANTIYVLEEGGKDLDTVTIGENPVFVLGDHIGLPKTVEGYALRYGEKISLAKQPYLAAQCITIINYRLDKQETHVR
jgi:tRNA (pseudouridine54-N1)-methyltransferase